MTETGAYPALIVFLAQPRGFCAGVERAIRTVEESLARHGSPVYVRHEIVHNAHVVARLKAMGAIFVDELEQAPGDRPVIFSAHGAPRIVHEEAARRRLTAIDATCPLVLKVHAEARRHAEAGRHVFLIGHAGHPEVTGTMGQIPNGAATLVETREDAECVFPPVGATALAYVTQTTLSVDDTRNIVEVLNRRFPGIIGPRKDDICYATSNRQDAVKAIAPKSDLIVVIGSPASSNSQRLVEVARAAGAGAAHLVECAEDFDWNAIGEARAIGVTAGASAPEVLVEDFLAELARRRPIEIRTVSTAREDVVFKTPLPLAS
ncbi:MAG: 4-hydroxy-3-methylbut-2-enyl diphosphate reductase [Parvularculaceae bacterium]